MSDLLAAAVQQTTNAATTDADLQLAARCRDLFQRARYHRRPLVAQWLKNYRILRNRTWVAGRADWMPSPEVPEIYPILTALVGWMTDQRPQIEAIPAAQLHSQDYNFFSRLAWDLQTVIQSSFATHNYESQLEMMLWDGYLYGTGFLKTTWDNSLVDGLGDFAIRRVDPFTFYPDPAATSMHDANYFIEARTMSIQDVDRRFPGAAKRLRMSSFTDDIDTSPNRLDNNPSSGPPRANPGAISPATSPRYGNPGEGRVNARQEVFDDGVTVFECWLREHSIQPNDEGDDQLIDEWRVVVVAGNEVLMDEMAMDVFGFARHPFTRYVPNETGEFWGQSLVELLAPAQLAINRLLASIQMNIELTGNPVFLEGTRAGIQRTKMTNKPGQRLTVNDNARAEWLNPPPVHELMPEMIRFYIAEMERVSGLSAMTRGSTPTGRNSQGVLDSIQEASFVRTRMALRNLEYALRDSGQLAASLVVDFYDEPRIVAVSGSGGDNSSIALKSQHFFVPSRNGRVPMRFQIKINAGSEMSTSSNARRSDAVQLLTLGALDGQAVLEAFNWPQRDQVNKRVQALKEAGLMQPPGARQKAGRTS